MEEIDLPELMAELLAAHHVMKEGAVPAIIHAAAISYGFVFMHPFEDGNGRIHRFLIHNILFLRGQIPKGLMFPVSAAMLKNPALYDHSLEAFSNPLMQLIEYDLDDLGQMTLQGESGAQNNGRLSPRKRASHFGFLTDAELADLENTVQKGYARD